MENMEELEDMEHIENDSEKTLQVNRRDKHGERIKAWFKVSFKPKLLE